MSVHESSFFWKKNMKIGFIGAGKVGTSLGKYLKQQSLNYNYEDGKCHVEKIQVDIIGYYSQSIESAKWAGDFTESKCYEDMGCLIKECDLIFITVPDSIIDAVVDKIIELDLSEDVLSKKCFCHCSGAENSSVFTSLREKGAYGCSLHPLCAVSSKEFGYIALKDACFTVEGNEKYLVELYKIIKGCGNQIEEIKPEMKVQYHMAAVFASNLVVGLYKEATELLTSCGLSEEFAKTALSPLFVNNAQKIAKDGVVEALTGPVERGDVSTIEKHLKTMGCADEKVVFGEKDRIREIYRLLSKSLISIATEKNPARDYEAVDNVLDWKM